MTTTLFAPSIISSFVEVVITQPLDVIKTHRQAGTTNQLKYDFKSLYRGFIPRAVGNIPSRSVFLFSQDYLKFKLDKKYHMFAVPTIAGFAQTLVDTPVEIMKMNQIFLNRNTFYYAGFVPHCLRNIIFLGFVFNMKEKGKEHNSVLYMSLYGAVGGLLGSYISHPLDTIKTIKQSQRSVKLIHLKDYFRGAHLRAGMGFINMSISLTMFELIKIFMKIDF
jgi:hypothetical protein